MASSKNNTIVSKSKNKGQDVKAWTQMGLLNEKLS